MANDRKTRRAERRAERFQRSGRGLNLYGYTNVTEKDFPNFVSLVEKLNKKDITLTQLNDDDFALFSKFAINTNPELLKKLTEAAKLEPGQADQLIEEGRKLLAQPANKQRLFEVSRKQDIANKSAAFSNAAGLFLVGADLASSVRQLSEYNRQLKEQKRPTRPGPMQADPYLAAAKKAAETGTFQESIAAKAARQQAFDAYQQDLQNSAVASTGQAGAYGAQAQAAVTRLGRRGAEMAPQIEAFRNQRQQQYGQMAQLSAAENDARYKSLAAPYQTDMEQYQREQASLAALGQSGRANLRTAMYDLGDYAGLAATPYVNRKYQALRAAMEARGMSPEEADKYAKGGSTPQSPNIQVPTQPINQNPAQVSAIAPGQPYATQPLNNKYSIFSQVPSSQSFSSQTPPGKFGPYFEMNAPFNFQAPIGPGITATTANTYGWGLPNQSDVTVPMRRPNPTAPAQGVFGPYYRQPSLLNYPVPQGQPAAVEPTDESYKDPRYSGPYYHPYYQNPYGGNYF